LRFALAGEEVIAAPPAEVWQRLLDPERVAACAPGVESVEALLEDRFRAVSSFGVGPARLRFRFDVALADLVRPESLRMTARGTAPGAEVSVETGLRLRSGSPGTHLDWNAEVDVRGVLARVGARLVKGESERQVREFFHRFAEGSGG
jgi:carbon monoxide dehydrogenase subunit G